MPKDRYGKCLRPLTGIDASLTRSQGDYGEVALARLRPLTGIDASLTRDVLVMPRSPISLSPSPYGD